MNARGWVYSPTGGGGTGYSFYGSSTSIAENNIVEDTMQVSSTKSGTPGRGDNTKYYGNIGIGGYMKSMGTDGYIIQNTIFEDNVIVNNWRCLVVTDSVATVNRTNIIDIPSTDLSYGVYFGGSGSLSVKNANIISSQGTAAFRGTISVSDSNVCGGIPIGATGGISTVNPQMGTCRVWVPDGSPPKAHGVGANVLYRYENGLLTNKPLWDPVTGAFPCGAIVPGVNDIAGSSCFDVHKRLNVNTNGCPFPAGYGG